MAYDSAFALAGLRVFGRGAGDPPAPVTPTASQINPVAAQLHWAPSARAQGYNIRYGREEGKLYHSWMVYGRNELTLSGLNASVDYAVVVDLFNENGITAGVPIHLS